MKAVASGLTAVAVLLVALPIPVFADAVYACRDARGNIRLQQLPCSAGETTISKQPTAPLPNPRSVRPSPAPVAPDSIPLQEVSPGVYLLPPGAVPLDPPQPVLTAPPDFVPQGTATSPSPPSRPREGYLDAAFRGVAMATLLFIGAVVVAFVYYGLNGLKAITRPKKQDAGPSITHGITKMNDDQKTICVIIAAVILAMEIYPPFHQHGFHGSVVNQGYGWIFAPPTATATVDIAMLLMQWMGVLIIGAIALVIAKK